VAAIIDEATRRNFDGAPHLRSWKEMHRQCFIGSIEARVRLQKKCAGDACFSSENGGARTACSRTIALAVLRPFSFMEATPDHSRRPGKCVARVGIA
jgi:hypothetical protein